MMRHLWLLPLLLCLHLHAWAHKASDAYLVVTADGTAVTAQWDIAVRDIDFALGLDQDGNGDITWGELRNRQADTTAWALSRLELTRGGGACPLQASAMQVDTHRRHFCRAEDHRHLPRCNRPAGPALPPAL
jgi:hypothetical protein